MRACPFTSWGMMVVSYVAWIPLRLLASFCWNHGVNTAMRLHMVYSQKSLCIKKTEMSYLWPQLVQFICCWVQIDPGHLGNLTEKTQRFWNNKPDRNKSKSESWTPPNYLVCGVSGVETPGLGAEISELPVNIRLEESDWGQVDVCTVKQLLRLFYVLWRKTSKMNKYIPQTSRGFLYFSEAVRRSRYGGPEEIFSPEKHSLFHQGLWLHAAAVLSTRACCPYSH